MASTSYAENGGKEDEYLDLVTKRLKEDGLDYGQNQILFHIKWEGYDDPDDFTWEPRENISHLSLFEEYIQKHGLRKLRNKSSLSETKSTQKKKRASSPLKSVEKKLKRSKVEKVQTKVQPCRRITRGSKVEEVQTKVQPCRRITRGSKVEKVQPKVQPCRRITRAYAKSIKKEVGEFAAPVASLLNQDAPISANKNKPAQAYDKAEIELEILNDQITPDEALTLVLVEPDGEALALESTAPVASLLNQDLPISSNKNKTAKAHDKAEIELKNLNDQITPDEALALVLVEPDGSAAPVASFLRQDLPVPTNKNVEDLHDQTTSDETLAPVLFELDEESAAPVASLFSQDLPISVNKNKPAQAYDKAEIELENLNDQITPDEALALVLVEPDGSAAPVASFLRQDLPVPTNKNVEELHDQTTPDETLAPVLVEPDWESAAPVASLLSQDLPISANKNKTAKAHDKAEIELKNLNDQITPDEALALVLVELDGETAAPVASLLRQDLPVPANKNVEELHDHTTPDETLAPVAVESDESAATLLSQDLPIPKLSSIKFNLMPLQDLPMPNVFKRPIEELKAKKTTSRAVPEKSPREIHQEKIRARQLNYITNLSNIITLVEKLMVTKNEDSKKSIVYDNLDICKNIKELKDPRARKFCKDALKNYMSEIQKKYLDKYV